MTEVFFYILGEDAGESPEHFACRLTEKAHGKGHRVYLHMPDQARVDAMDRLLWQFRQGSFVPHGRADALADDDDITPVVVGAGVPPTHFDDISINIDGEVGDFFSRFARHNEIVGPQGMAAARNRYRFFKDRGYALKTHKIPAG